MEIEINKIYNEDCIEFLKRVPDNFFDLIFADPPFPYDDDFITLNSQDYGNWCRKWIEEGWRTLKSSGFFVILTGVQYLDWLNDEMSKYGNLYCNIKWENNMFTEDPKLVSIEPVICYSYRNELNIKEQYWDYKKIGYSPTEQRNLKEIIISETGCNTIIPVRLADTIIRQFTVHEDVVYDMFVGSGIFLDVCRSLGRDFIGTELNNNFFESLTIRRSYIGG